MWLKQFAIVADEISSHDATLHFVATNLADVNIVAFVAVYSILKMEVPVVALKSSNEFVCN